MGFCWLFLFRFEGNYEHGLLLGYGFACFNGLGASFFGKKRGSSVKNHIFSLFYDIGLLS
jgi:hypothetical protein